MTLQEWGAIANIVTGLVTPVGFVVLIVYTVETYKLRTTAQQQLRKLDDTTRVSQAQVREARIQNETAIMPILMLDTANQKRMAGSLDDTFVLRNLGFGPAFNVSISSDCEDIIVDALTHVGQGQAIPTGIILGFETPDQQTLSNVVSIQPMFRNETLPERIEVMINYESANRKKQHTRLALEYNPNTDYVFISFLGAEVLPFTVQ